MTDAVGKVEALAAERDRRRSKPWPVFTMAEVARHCYSDDAWIVVSDKVYDMTAHVQHHEGWVGSGKVSTLLALLSAMGTDCSIDFNSTHDARGFRELHAYQVGILDRPHKPTPVRYFTWEQLSASGRIRNRPRAAAAPPRLADRAGPPPAERANARPPPESAAAPQPAERATAALCGFCECSPCADGCPGLERSDCQGAL
ncbi:hypothetical protein EMIHUDRAFT_438232 [Emiliania huxleyi CCMP1516]|uniref:Cytochrome b5 heme-binding domain-containing protein n=2 Tax=Emiliania huxleyi TaxID=2903 RepID=A0A0D3IC40_EMIH1|nr:hypothetical protein EMIHUDRAFT_438232 [Emiliania huxleyi CCMP1516]EOD08825.1 hypothetical protein EMIHUDRAFT_438232 [Emiliania huxleyi CCMP1516]|eukprot:XP_005761254.1 hypothetical protein EMIHUDRAFT_438232 [Emiliania huxleyi CCMP1516]